MLFILTGEDLTDRYIRSLIRYGRHVCGTVLRACRAMGAILSPAFRSMLMTPHGIICIVSLFHRQRHADPFHARFNAHRSRKGSDISITAK